VEDDGVDCTLTARRIDLINLAITASTWGFFHRIDLDQILTTKFGAPDVADFTSHTIFSPTGPLKRAVRH